MADPAVALIEQAPDGTLLPGAEGERLIESRDIYSVFSSPEEYRVVAVGGRSIGQVPVENPVVPGQLMLLGGRRWRVLEVDASRKEVLVAPASGGKPPRFGGEARTPADAVVVEMRRVLETTEIPSFLDKPALDFLLEGRTTFNRLGLHRSRVARHDGDLLMFPWAGAAKHQTLMLALVAAKLEPTNLGLCISVDAARLEPLIAELTRSASGVVPDALALASHVEQNVVEKFDSYLGNDLLNLAYAGEHLDISGLPAVAATLLEAFRQNLSP
jgi:ATP-dependent Lhr-like helicase